LPHQELDRLRYLLLDPALSLPATPRVAALTPFVGRGTPTEREQLTAEGLKLLMMTRMTWPELCRSEKFKGVWVALDNCRYDQATRQPIEGDVVDADEELAALCARMRETGRTSCAILYCEDEVLVETRRPLVAGSGERRGLAG
jgi:hypothetical protein